MGINCIVTLPEDVRVRDVADVIGILAGLKKKKHIVPSWVIVNHVRIESTDCPSIVEIVLNSKVIDGNSDHYIFYHFESENGGRVLMPKSTPFWIAISKGLVDFFGGSIDYNDSDGAGKDYQRFKPRKRNNPQDDQEWDDFQNDIWNLQPLTEKDLIDAKQYAAYK